MYFQLRPGEGAMWYIQGKKSDNSITMSLHTRLRSSTLNEVLFQPNWGYFQAKSFFLYFTPAKNHCADLFYQKWLKLSRRILNQQWPSKNSAPSDLMYEALCTKQPQVVKETKAAVTRSTKPNKKWHSWNQPKQAKSDILGNILKQFRGCAAIYYIPYCD